MSVLLLACAAVQLAAVLGGCATEGEPATGAAASPFAGGDFFRDNSLIDAQPHPGMLYATYRAPADAPDEDHRFYTRRRGGALRLGIGEITTAEGHGDSTWADARLLPLLNDEAEDFPLRVSAVHEFGLLPGAVSPLAPAAVMEAAPGAAESFRSALRDRIRTSGHGDVYFYVHGFKVSFENPLLVASELWHYLDYRGSFVAFSWSSRESVFGYMADVESAQNAARGLRMLLLEIAALPEVERIHILGYSAGTRVVAGALADLALLDSENTAAVRAKLRRAMLVSSDMDRETFTAYLLDGALEQVGELTIYQSATDQALNMSERVFRRPRLGQRLAPEDLTPAARRWLLAQEKLHVIDASEAADADAGIGHSYLRASAWTSSDILATLRYDLPPAVRGLERDADYPVWRFPEDYPERLYRSLMEQSLLPPQPDPAIE